MTLNQVRDLRSVRRPAGQEVLRDPLDLPRAIAAEIVAADRPGSRLVIDIGSGTGTFLDRFLAVLPQARGVWSDVSAAWAAVARERLAPYAARVDFQLADMTDLRGLPFPADVITSSHASHHLSPEQLRQFYAEARARLASGGWLVNLDQTYWEGHHSPVTPPTAAEHLSALRAAGFADLDTPWREFPTCLFMARRSDHDG